VDTSSQGGPRGDANRVFVSNLPWSVDNSALANLFRGQGKVLEASIAYDRDSGRAEGQRVLVSSRMVLLKRFRKQYQTLMAP
jgi:RNA recognition motif-containing protein